MWYIALGLSFVLLVLKVGGLLAISWWAVFLPLILAVLIIIVLFLCSLAGLALLGRR